MRLLNDGFSPNESLIGFDGRLILYNVSRRNHECFKVVYEFRQGDCVQRRSLTIRNGRSTFRTFIWSDGLRYIAIVILMAHGQWVNHLIRLGSSVHDDGVSDDDVTVASALELNRPVDRSQPQSPIAKYKNNAERIAMNTPLSFLITAPTPSLFSC